MDREFSVYLVVDWMQDLVAEHPFQGADTVRYPSSHHRGDFSINKPIRGNLNLDLFEAACQCIWESGDDVNVYIHSFIKGPVISAAVWRNELLLITRSRPS